MMPEQVFNREGLLARLTMAHTKAEREYIELLFDGKYDEAADKLTKMDSIEAHINRVEEL